MSKKIAFIAILFIGLFSCSKEESGERADLAKYEENEAINLNYKCFLLFNQFAVKETNTYENGAVEVVYSYTANVMNAQYQGTVDLVFDNYAPTNISFGGLTQEANNLSISGSGSVVGLMDSYNGQYVTTYSGHLNGIENSKSFQIDFNYEIVQSQSLSSVGYFTLNGVKYEFAIDGSSLPNLVM